MKKLKPIFPLTIFIVGLICGIFINQNLLKKNTAQLQAAPSPVNNQTIKANNQPFPFLDLPMEYFSDKDVKSGSAGKDTGEKITDYTEVFLKNNKTVYQSYPTTTITIKDYSNEIKPLKIRSINEIISEISYLDPSDVESLVKANYKEYGNLASNYLLANSIWGLDKFDVDGDGLAETAVMYNFVGSADGGSYRSDIIKGNNIIFSVQEDNAGIVPADTTNGFYVEWGSIGNGGRCCSEGFMRTRFVFKDGKFTPIYEQEVRYLKIGKE